MKAAIFTCDNCLEHITLPLATDRPQGWKKVTVNFLRERMKTSSLLELHYCPKCHDKKNNFEIQITDHDQACD